MTPRSSLPFPLSGLPGRSARSVRATRADPNLLYFRWGQMLDTLGIKRVRLHDARHSRGASMHLRGVPIAVIAAWLGHASAAFTAALYLHSQNEALKAAANSFGRVVTTGDTETGSAS